jgi:hypothetical protein
VGFLWLAPSMFLAVALFVVLSSCEERAAKGLGRAGNSQKLLGKAQWKRYLRRRFFENAAS